jgi:hypothetical protein
LKTLVNLASFCQNFLKLDYIPILLNAKPPTPMASEGCALAVTTSLSYVIASNDGG